MPRISRASVGIVAALLVVSGCRTRSEATDAGNGERMLVIGTLHEPDTLDPVFAEIAGAQEIIRLLFRDLTANDERWTLVPDLAAELPLAETTTAGAMRVRWRLRPGLKWSDGRPLTTEDLVFGYRIESDPTLAAPSHSFIKRIQRMVAVSPIDLLVVWRAPGIDFASPRVHAVLPAHAYPRPTEGIRFAGMNKSPVSNGPFRLREWVPGQHLTVERNPHWTGSRPALSAVMVRFLAGEESFEAELQTRGIDAVGEGGGLTPERARSLETRLAATHRVYRRESGLWLHIDARLDHPVTGRLEVRQAIDLALDRAALVELAFRGDATPAAGLFPPRHPATQNMIAPHDVKRARQLIKTARLPDRRVTLAFASGSEASERIATYVKAQLEAVGLEVQLESLPFRSMFARMREKKQAPLVLYAWRTGPEWDARSILHTSGEQNFVGLSDAALDGAFARAEHADRAEWAAALREVERRYRELLPSISLLYRPSVSVAPADLEGWRPTGSNTPVTWNAEQWRFRGAEAAR